ncbi:DNA-binding protein [Candidatus Omnitrophota bacterium]
MGYSKFYVAVLICFLAFVLAAFAEPTQVADLINEGTLYNGQRVVVEGEAIGHLMKRGDFAWFNVNDGTLSIGVWAPVGIASQVQFLGRHAVIGDQVKIEGVFNSHCSVHGGDTDIHAESIVVTEVGREKLLSHDPKKVNILIFLTGIMVCLYIIKTLKRPH